MPDAPTRHDADPFYVGYLPTPPRHLRFVRLLVGAMLPWMVAFGVVLAAGMRDPGAGTWDTATERTWTGTLRLTPYPTLIPDDGTGPLLVVEMAKHGAQPRVAPLDGRRVEVRGFLMQRDDRRLIELAPDDTALTDLGAGLPDHRASVREVPVTLTGEIVDGKCYLGAMKPGDGIAHKSCATLCLRGGLPPMFVSDDGGGPVFRLLLVDGSADLPDPVLALVAERVRVEGVLTDANGVPTLATTARGITRLD